MTKIKSLFLLFIVSFLLIVYRLFIFQVLKKSNISPNNYLQTKKIMPERGRLYDRNMKPLVLNQNSYLLFVEPKKVSDKKELIEKLDKVLKIGAATIEAKIDFSKDWVAIRSGLDDEQKRNIDKLNLKAVGFEQGTKRYYPEASLSAHLAGFVGKNEKSEDIGYFGIEGFYDKDLIGMPGFFQTERDLMNRPIFIGTQEKFNAEDGRDLVLTIDKSIQEIVKRKLNSSMQKYESKQGYVIVANPKTMEILALVCLPDYDPGNYFLYSEEIFKNPAISEVYEPGSTFKPLIVAAALEEKRIKADSFYQETGPVTIGEYSIKTWNDKYEGKISITRLLEKSSNVGMVYIGEKLGNKNIIKYLDKYGFGQFTGIDLQGETSGYIRQDDQWYPIDYATVTFGQGIAVTPIQMLKAFAGVINGGKLLQPFIVKKIIANGKEKEFKPKIQEQIVSRQVSEVIKKMLVSTVENGEIKWAAPKGYVIGGKTGTAQIAIKGHYDPTKTIASFIGFAPAEEPKFIALVILKEPGSSQWGSETAAPLFFDIAKELLMYYNIAPQQ